jgi:ABC-type molybdate transport system substrate-binding protein
MSMSLRTRTLTSIGIALASLGLTYAPLPGAQQTITVVSGSELQAPLAVLEERFEQEHPNIRLDIEIQGSQDIVNNYIDDRNDFAPTVLIPANQRVLDELAERWQAQAAESPFYGEPQPIAQTYLVAIAWPQRGKLLFPNGQFQWDSLENAVTKGNWSDLGGRADWGSFDLVITDPTRSNSGQLALSLWSQAKLGTQTIDPSSFNSSELDALFSTVKRSVYLPPRSTDILLQEYITRGPNEADVAFVYESIALHRWEQAATSQGEPYQIYYLDPTIATVSTAAILKSGVGRGKAEVAEDFVEFLLAPEQQTVFVQFGFRPMNPDVDLQSVPDSPWSQGIPGAEVTPSGQVANPPDRQTVNELIRLWQRSQ